MSLLRRFIITNSNEGYIFKFKIGLMKESEMTGLGLTTHFLGIGLLKSKKGLLMHQRRYTLEILKNIEMEHYNVTITPAEPRLHMSKNEDK